MKKYLITSKYSKNKYILPFNEINKFYTENKNINVNGGRSNSLKILKHMINFKNYSKDRDYLTYKTTFLSASLHFGTVSIRETYFAMIDKLKRDNPFNIFPKRIILYSILDFILAQ